MEAIIENNRQWSKEGKFAAYKPELSKADPGAFGICVSTLERGILAAVPGRMGIGVVGLALDNKGNSIGGIKILEELSREMDLSIF